MAKITKEQVELLKDFSFAVTGGDFTNIFGERIGTRQWGKFRTAQPYNIIDLWSTLDTDNRKKLIAYINKRSKRHLKDDDFEKERWIKATLTNDEVSTDAELVAHFMKEGPMTRKEAERWVAKRDAYLRGHLT